MGFVKSQWEEAQSRGWSAPDKFVCDECVEDEFLKSLVQDMAAEKKCYYCDRTSEENISAPVEAILEPIASTLFAHFAEPVHSGMPRNDGEWLCEDGIIDIWEALASIGLCCNDGLFDDIADSFYSTSWYPCAHGHWSDMHEHEELQNSWKRFDQTIKHESRYFFLSSSIADRDHYKEDYSPSALLTKIGELVERLSLIKIIAPATVLYRVRGSDPESKYYS